MSAFQAGPETFVTISSIVRDAEGDIVSGPDVSGFVFAMGQLKPELERALEGRGAGEVVRVVLSSAQAFGRRNPGRVIEVAREEFPEDVGEGDRFELEDARGDLVLAHVLEVHPDFLVLDTNHPLADQDVAFEISVLEVRPASNIEMRAAEAELAQAEAELAQAEGLELGGGAPFDPIPLVPASNLIRARNER